MGDGMLLGFCLTRKEIKFPVSDVRAVNECSSHSLTSGCYLLACRIAFVQGCYCPRIGGDYCNLCVYVYVCLSVCPRTYLIDDCTCYLWPWLGPPQTTLQYIMYLRFCG